MKKLEHLNIIVNDTGRQLHLQKIINSRNRNRYIEANRSFGFFKSTNDISTEFTPVDLFIEDIDSEDLEKTKVTAIFKHWDISVYVNRFSSTTLEEDLDYILPLLKYEIIYQDTIEGNLTYYNSNDDLHSVYFYEIRDEELILHVSFLARKAFDGPDMLAPQAKLRVSFSQSITMNN